MKSQLACTEVNFLRDVAKHQLTIVKDDDMHRHLNCKMEHSSTYYFNIITWPGSLCISGDCGTYVFSRTHDMFSFFRMDKDDLNFKKDRTLQINPGYWEEKVVSKDANSGIQQFSSDRFRKAVAEYFKISITGRGFSKEKKKDIWRQIELDLLSNIENEYITIQKTFDFEYEGFTFVDFFDQSFSEYTFRYIWCLYAIVWAIKKYDDFFESFNSSITP